MTMVGADGIYEVNYGYAKRNFGDEEVGRLVETRFKKPRVFIGGRL